MGRIVAQTYFAQSAGCVASLLIRPTSPDSAHRNRVCRYGGVLAIEHGALGI